MGQSIREKYGALFEKVASVSKAAAKITEFNNYQEANPEAKKFADLLVTETIPDSSEIKNLESLKDLYDRVTTKGQSGLIMAEHYSNLDFPEILYILEKTGEPWAKDMASRIVAIAGMKLNESGAFVRLYAESFTRVVVYPSRSQASFQGTPEEKEAEVQRAKKINFAKPSAPLFSREGLNIIKIMIYNIFRPRTTDEKNLYHKIHLTKKNNFEIFS